MVRDRDVYRDRDRDVIRDEGINTAPGNYEGYKRAAGVFYSQDEVEEAIRALKHDGFDTERISLIARNLEGVEGADEVTDQHGNEAKEGAAAGATTGTVLGGLGGFLVGVGLLAIPGVGPLLAAGAEISAIASTLAGAGIGAAAGGLIGALVGAGIPEEHAKTYESRIKAGSYFLMVTGTDEEIRRAETLLNDHGVEEFGIYDAPAETVRPTKTVAREAVVTEPRPTTRGTATATDTRDLDADGDPEVIIVDKRDNVRGNELR